MKSERLRDSAMAEARQRKGTNRRLSEDQPDLDADVVKFQDKLEKAQEKAAENRRRLEYNERAVGELYRGVTTLNEADKLRAEGDTAKAEDLETDARYLISMYTGKNSIVTSNPFRNGYKSY